MATPTITRTRPMFDMWCDLCDGPAIAVMCDMTGENDCEACHAYIECPCQNEEI